MNSDAIARGTPDLPDEDARLDAHFREVLTELHARSLRGLSRAQRRARQTHLSRLDQYRQRRRFPRNLHHPFGAVPIFVDDFGTRCAMAHLIEQAGDADLMQDVARARNTDRVHALADIAALGAWLEANGLTVDEAARIQPSYCMIPAYDCVCNHAAQGLLEGTADGAGNLTVSAIHAGPLDGVQVGDTVLLEDAGGLTQAGDIVFAKWFASSDVAQATFVGKPKSTASAQTVNPQSGCTWATSPGPVPYPVFVQAISKGDFLLACAAQLEAHDPAWLQPSGHDCGGGSGTGGYPGTGAAPGTGGAAASNDTDGGCAVARPGALGGELVLALGTVAVALGVRQLRRVQRRPH